MKRALATDDRSPQLQLLLLPSLEHLRRDLKTGNLAALLSVTRTNTYRLFSNERPGTTTPSHDLLATLDRVQNPTTSQGVSSSLILMDHKSGAAFEYAWFTLRLVALQVNNIEDEDFGRNLVTGSPGEVLPWYRHPRLMVVRFSQLRTSFNKPSASLS